MTGINGLGDANILDPANNSKNTLKLENVSSPSKAIIKAKNSSYHKSTRQRSETH